MKLGVDRSALILGSSLGAIDAAVALAQRYGAFVEDGDKLSFEPASKEKFRIAQGHRAGC